MSADSAAMQSAPAAFVARRLPDPLQAYRAYLAAIAKGDRDGVKNALTQERVQELFYAPDAPGFDVLFDLWCQSQDEPIVILRCTIENHLAIVDIRTRNTEGQVELRWVCGAWRIDSEVHRPRAERAGDVDGDVCIDDLPCPQAQSRTPMATACVQRQKCRTIRRWSRCVPRV